MTIDLNRLKGDTGYVIIIDSQESWKHFQKLIQNGSGLYPDLPAEIKIFADEVTVGKALQPYKDDPKKITKADIEEAFSAGVSMKCCANPFLVPSNMHDIVDGVKPMWCANCNTLFPNPNQEPSNAK